MDDNTAIVLMIFMFTIINIVICVSENWRNK